MIANVETSFAIRQIAKASLDALAKANVTFVLGLDVSFIEKNSRNRFDSGLRPDEFAGGLYYLLWTRRIEHGGKQIGG